MATFLGRFRRRGFVGLGLGLCFAVVSAWRCLRGAFLAVAGRDAEPEPEPETEPEPPEPTHFGRSRSRNRQKQGGSGSENG